MGTPLRFADDQLAAKKLDALVLVEDADVDHAVVLRPAPASRADRILHDGVEATARVQARQCRRMRTLFRGGGAAMSLFKNVSHVSITVTDVEKARDFYTGVL